MFPVVRMQWPTRNTKTSCNHSIFTGSVTVAGTCTTPTLVRQVMIYSYLQSIEWSIDELCVHKHIYSASQISMRPRTSHVPTCNHCQWASTAAVPNLTGNLEPGSSTVSEHPNLNLIRKQPSSTCDRSVEWMKGCSNPMYEVSDGPTQPAIWQ